MCEKIFCHILFFYYFCDAMTKLITIIGPTASGKTPFAAMLAAQLQAEIISGDSRQVYRRMDIGTGKDLADYVVGGQQIPYHLIDIEEPGKKYNLFRYQQDFLEVYEKLRERSTPAILCGGTGLYIEAVLKGYALSPVPQNSDLREALKDKTLDELTKILEQLKVRNHSALHNRTDVDTVNRAIRAIEIETFELEHPTPDRAAAAVDSLIIGLNIDRASRREKISRRLQQRLNAGMVEEVRALLAEGISPADLIYYGLEYKYLTQYILGEMTHDEMFRALEIAIHQFAKRQMTWFRGMERRGFKINWIDATLPQEEKIEWAMKLIKNDATCCP